MTWILRFWDRISGGHCQSAIDRATLAESALRSFRAGHEAWGLTLRELPSLEFALDFRRILADYNQSILEAKSPAARGKLAAPAFYAILEAARLHGIQPLGSESLGEQGTKERKEA